MWNSMNKLIYILISAIPIWINGQVNGNEWINYNQQYYKFPILNSGIHRISYSTMVNAGIPVSTINSNKFQIFGREKEVPIHIVDGGDNSINSGDYIEFYAKENDGWLDSVLYQNPDGLGNPEYSLYNDTIYYFLSWINGSGNNEQYTDESDVSFSNYSPRNYFLRKLTKNYNSNYYGGFNVSNSYSSYFDDGEGWGGPNYNGANGFSLTIPFTTTNLYSGVDAPSSVFEGKSNSNSNATYNGSGNHHLRWDIGTSNFTIHDQVFSGYSHININEPLVSNLLDNGVTNVYFKIIGDLGVATDYQSVSYVSLTYPSEPNLNNESYMEFIIDDNLLQAKNRFELNNADLVNPVCLVYGGLIPRSIPMVLNNGIWSILIPNSGNGNNQSVIISSEESIIEIENITAVNSSGFFRNFNVENYESALLIYYHSSLSNGANQYKTYRQSVTGGNNNVILVDVDELYLQFGGGIPKHALALKRLAQLAYNLSTSKPKALMILGKGVREANEINSSTGPGSRKNLTSYQMSLIPSFGYPSSDICITSNFNNSGDWKTYIPIGRIAAKDNQDVLDYLEKIQLYENAQNQSAIYNKPQKEWQKQILHFGGGITTSEQNLFKQYLNGFKFTIENEFFGGNVTSYFKDNSNPFNPVLNSDVNEKLENGISLMTFFGHGSAGGGFDQNVDNPENWNNMGKYPVVIGNSCYTGDIFMPNYNSISERFILIPNNGAIGFISSTKLGFANYLNAYTGQLYEEISDNSYGNFFASQISNTIDIIQGTNGTHIMEATCAQMNLHGDPLLKLNWHAKPEIDLTVEDVFFSPSQITLSTDSIDVNVILTNLGRSIIDSFEVVINRNFPNSSSDSTYRFYVSELHYKDTVKYTMALQPDIGLGLNDFTISVDLPSFIDENYDEIGNNEISKSLFIDADGIIPILPFNYAVVPNDEITLKASTINPISDFATYRFEIDTTDTYDSPFRKYAFSSGLGGVHDIEPGEWLNSISNINDPLQLTDSSVYFWRVALDTVDPSWIEHSFQYIPNKEGWGQDHFFQFKNNDLLGLEYNRPARKKFFQPIEKLVSCDVYDNANTNITIANTLWRLDAQMQEYGWCTTTPSIHVAVIDPISLEAWGTFNNGNNPDHQFGNANNGSACRNRVEKYFIFRQNSTAQLQALQSMLENSIPEGHFVLIYTAARAQYSNWQTYLPSLFATMESLGATGMDTLSPERAFIFFTQKGNSTYTTEIHAVNSGDFITTSIPIFGFNDIGLETSPVIGPASQWETIYWKQNSLDEINEDETMLTIRALDANQIVAFEIDTVFSANDSILNLNSLIPAQQYPFLQLKSLHQDSTNGTPSQIDSWHVLYSPLPEAAIDGTNGYLWQTTSNSSSINEGDEISFAIDVKNISELDMDSILINYWILDENQNIHPIPYDRQDSLRSSKLIRDTLVFSTNGLHGANVFQMELNPYINYPVKDQPELTHINNILQIPFEVGNDNINPILDVTFDGLHILNGDIVSPNSEIVITLKDENPYLIMNQDSDTSLFGIYLRSPDGMQKRIPFINSNGEPILIWEPANETNLKFKITYLGNFSTEGVYELLVQGSDKSGNLSGDLEYKISFEVINSSAITHMMNYPNPFSSSTQFVFTLTGSKIPDEIQIQIMSVTGKVVREISEDELGTIRIGRNITDFAWDGKDDFGDQLANGVYLYKVKAKIDGEDIEHLDSGADQYMERNWGKMYLMR